MSVKICYRTMNKDVPMIARVSEIFLSILSCELELVQLQLTCETVNMCEQEEAPRDAVATHVN